VAGKLEARAAFPGPVVAAVPGARAASITGGAGVCDSDWDGILTSGR
jgi:hypothetical protein